MSLLMKNPSYLINHCQNVVVTIKYFFQIVTYELLFRCIIGFWIISATWTFLPLVGFGSYYKDGNCSRYRDATTVRDKIYAYLFFVFGKLSLKYFRDVGWV